VPHSESTEQVPAVQMPAVHRPPVPQSRLRVQVPAVQVPVWPEPPHTPPSHSLFWWHEALAVLHVPAVEPMPLPHELLSQSPFW
jgi:hypothetical protein